MTRWIPWVLGALLSLAPLSDARAAAYDPDLTWRTLTTPHFNITFHGGEEQLAEETSRVAEEIWLEMTEEMAWTPRRRTEVVLVDHTDMANGYATTLPVNTIVIFVTAPQEGSTLSNYEDWTDAILTHEYTHILHLDTVEGLPAALRMVIGRIVAVNRIAPGWVIEGLATLQETRHTNGGRGRSTVVDMIKRMAVIEDDFPPLGNLDGWQTDPPGGNLRYLFGQDFQQYISDASGEQVWTDFVHRYGGSIPYLLPSRKVFGGTLLHYYKEWKAALTERYLAEQARLEAEGLTPFRILSDGVDQCAGPTFSPSGNHIVWACSDPHVGASIYLAGSDGSDPEVELESRYASDFVWRADSSAFAFSSNHVVNRFNLYSDIYLKPLKGRLTALTQGKRARNPAFSPDGRELLVITNRVQNNQLARMTIDQRLVELTEFDDHTQLSTPAFSPDGRHIALSMWRHGQRDLWILDQNGTFLRRLTIDLAQDLDPWWSADGQTLYFSSDRTGIFNIYAIDLDTERLWQVTNVLGGAFRPSVNPQQTAMVFESYSHNGVDVAWMDLDRTSWQDRGLLPMPLEHRTALATVLPAPGSIEVPEPSPPKDSAEDTSSDKKRAGIFKRMKSQEFDSSLLEPLPYPGIDGLGGPFQLARQLDPSGSWGRPGEPRFHGHMLDDAPVTGPDAEDSTETEQETPDEESFDFTYPVNRYNPVPTMLPPRFVIPGIYRTVDGFMGTLNTGGVDLLRRYLYNIGVTYRTDSKFTGWGASVALNRFIPLYTAGAYTFTVPYGDVYAYPGPPSEGGSWLPTIQSTGKRYWDKRLQAYIQVAWPRSDYRSVFARWTGTLRQPLDPLEATDYRPFLPTRGFLSSVGGGWRMARGRGYAKSISPEEARILSVVGQLSHPLLGSFTLDDTDQIVPFTQLQLTGEWREYRTMPWFQNQVLAWKLAMGASGGDAQRYGSFRLGGSFGDGAYNTLPDEWRTLRGFPPATVYGDWFYLGSLEYRVPVWNIDRGFGTIPFFARSISAYPFLDIGNAFESPDSAEANLGLSRVGAGAELRATFIVGWGVGLALRLGYGFSVYGAGGYSLGDLDGAYAWLGSSF